MTQEEKAKAYDKTVGVCRKLYNKAKANGYTALSEAYEQIFPELKESEDERIRKKLLSSFKCMMTDADKDELWYGLSYNDIIAWLEKQGTPAKLSEEEQNRFAKGVLTSCAMSFINYLDAHKYEGKMCVSNGECEDIENAFHNAMWDRLHRYYCKYIEKQGENPADKVEPKFKVGDSISKKHNSDINKFGIFTITSIADNKYWYNDSVVCDFSDQDLWELVECPKFKKGDWVFHNTAEFIYMIQTIGRDGYGVISRDGKKSVVYYSAEINYRLWTIQDAKDGDVLVDGNLPFIFKKIDTNRYSYAYCGISVDDGFKIESDGEFGEWTWMQDIKPATKEQRDILFQKMKESGYEWNAEKKELKQVEQKSAWSEQDEELIKCSINNLTELKDRFGEEYGKVGDCITWLKHLKDRVQPQPKQEWSEEDEEHIKSLLERLEGMCKKDATFIRTKFAVSEDEDWLKSLSPQSRWKPSKEQMKALWNVYQGGKEQAELATLYNDLKKLREE